ncbi:erythromycin esterase family protein [Halorutilales archaeon Cl-col2-1]
MSREDTVAAARQNSVRLTQTNIDSLVDEIGDANYVLLGEASHGTSEYYVWRSRITARLIDDKGFSFVGVEGDWPDCYRINRYVTGETQKDAYDVVSEFERWPQWMWANWEVHEFVDWLRRYNAKHDSDVGFYGLDVYSLFDSMERVVEYLEDVDPEAAEEARKAYACFEPYSEDAREYSRSLRMVPETCEDEVVEILSHLEERQSEYVGRNHESFFDAEQNALVAKKAEEYYRSLTRGGKESWNVRDRHMTETAERLVDYHSEDEDANAKAVIWAHNTHVGDARATDMPDRGRINLGQLIRETNPDEDVEVVGFGSHHGDVIASSSWGETWKEMAVPKAKQDSYEDVFYEAGGDFILDTDSHVFDEERGHRAIGVVYNPRREAGNYVPTSLSNRYDYFVFLSETDSLNPIRTEETEEYEPETYPWGV